MYTHGFKSTFKSLHADEQTQMQYTHTYIKITWELKYILHLHEHTDTYADRPTDIKCMFIYFI